MGIIPLVILLFLGHSLSLTRIHIQMRPFCYLAYPGVVIIVQTEHSKKALDARLDCLFSMLSRDCPESSPEIFSHLLQLLECIVFWESTHNIISKKMSQDLIVDSIIDSVEGGFFLNDFVFKSSDFDGQILDAGSGGGFPGVPLALIYKDIKFILVDSDRKKCSFLRYVKSKLNIKNIEVLNKKLENLSPAMVVVTRAAFPPERSNILAKAVKQGGILAIWSTPEACEVFKQGLGREGVKMCRKRDYELGQDLKKRSVLLFKKAR